MTFFLLLNFLLAPFVATIANAGLSDGITHTVAVQQPAPAEYTDTFFFPDELGRTAYRYTAYIPAHDASDEPLPLVMAFHGGGDTALDMRRMIRLDDVADKEGFIVVYPQAPEGLWTQRWDKETTEVEARDIAFLSPFIDMLKRTYPIDPGRIYATGFSTGALYIQRTACSSGIFAAIVPVSGWDGLLTSCIPTPVLVWHEAPADDKTIGYNWENPPWAASNECAQHTTEILPERDNRAASTLVKKRFFNCTDEAEVVVYSAQGGVHAWPDRQIGDPAVSQNPQTFAALMWNFFSDYDLHDTAQ